MGGAITRGSCGLLTQAADTLRFMAEGNSEAPVGDSHKDLVFRAAWPGDLNPTALLADSELKSAIEDLGLLIDKDVFYDPTACKYAGYEVHAAPEVGYVDYLESGELEERRRSNSDWIRIEAGQTARLFTAEAFYLPADVFATVTGLGQLYAAGLVPGSTYVDPGTRNRIYLSVSNVSDGEVRIPVGAPIGRAQFFVLGTPATRLKKDTWRSRIGYERGPSTPVVREPDLNVIRKELLEIVGERDGKDLALVPETSRIREISAKQRSNTLLLAVLFAYVFAVTLPSGVWSFLSGENLPPLLKFLIPAVAGGVLFVLFSWLARTLRSHFVHASDDVDSDQS